MNDDERGLVENKYKDMSIALISSLRRQAAFQDAVEQIRCYVHHPQRKQQEDEIMDKLYTAVMNCTKNVFLGKLCGVCGHNKFCADAEGIAVNAATDGLIKAVQDFQGKRRDDIEEEQAFLSYLAQSVAGRLVKECKRECRSAIKRELVRKAVDKDDQLSFEEYIDIIARPQGTENPELDPPDPHSPLQIISRWIAGQREGLSSRCYSHVKTIYEQIIAVIPNILREGYAEAVAMFLYKQNNMNILGFQEVGMRVEEICCGNRRAFDVHQKRVRAALKEQIELGGGSRA